MHQRDLQPLQSGGGEIEHRGILFQPNKASARSDSLGQQSAMSAGSNGCIHEYLAGLWIQCFKHFDRKHWSVHWPAGIVFGVHDRVSSWEICDALTQDTPLKWQV